MPHRHFCLYTAILLLLLSGSCLKQVAEYPPYQGAIDPKLPVNGTLAWLNAQTPQEGKPLLLDTDITIAVVVRADDRSGNTYEQLVVEDSSRGICILVNAPYLYTIYPIGRKVYLKLKGLYLGNEHGLSCIGSIPAPDNAGMLQVSAISSQQVASHLIPADFPQWSGPVATSLGSIDTVNPALLNRLILINGIQLVNPGYDRTYALAAAAVNIRLQDCEGHEVILRSSNYASFRAATTPSGKGSITAIYSVYNGTPQLLIRDTGDVRMLEPRCDGSSGIASILTTLDKIRQHYKGRDTLLNGYKVTGIVITEAASRNHGAGGSMVLQDESAGILVYFGSGATGIPVLGDSVLLDLEGSTLTSYNNTLEIKNIRTSAAIVAASGRTVTPLLLTIAELLADFSRYESRLVRIDHAKVKNSGNYSGSKTLTDGTGEIVLFTSSAASFATLPLPAISKTFQGIATWYDTIKEIKIRHPDIDVY
jgi:hypothetical protein